MGIWLNTALVRPNGTQHRPYDGSFKPFTVGLAQFDLGRRIERRSLTLPPAVCKRFFSKRDGSIAALLSITG
ncbi:hypothetical protein MZK49_20485 [Ensifer sesbaniae]|uniref:hypothetical protein n=1 Tax=Ensifer sesbaniae TaxID=1214071 RepID=UPI002000686D|nr:hypothetical protein [Ensifer sesbaniae]